ncbi:hypothetical protein DEU56DRAFT_721254, partial [Suillus clintonianus]|uniref:uncharacterized protein n=1 Tax=Suillus clintonianus TaxID=1904413 RepID=UPI001B86B583
RSHMGRHILCAVRGIEENLPTPVSGSLPCGFCGSSGNPDCAVTLKETNRGINWETWCPRKEDFQYGSANKGSNNRPCRNVPIVCKLCVHPNREMDWKPAIWRYNLEAHLTEEHPEYAHPGKPSGASLPHDMFECMLLTPLEEKRLGVP